MRLLTRARISWGILDQSAVMKSLVSTLAQGDHVVVAAAVAHDADGADRQNRLGKRLGGGAIEPFGDDFFEEDFVGIAEEGEFFLGDFADAAHGQAGTGEGVTPDDVLGQAEEFAEFADFILEEVAEGFDEVEAEFGGEAADVVVELDVGGGLAAGGVAVAGFDDIRVEGSLGEEAGVLDLAGFGFEDVDESFADDFAFFLGVGDALEAAVRKSAMRHRRRGGPHPWK